jgi:hypothetical protein
VPKVSGSTAGDFAETLYWVIRSRFEDNSSMTIADVNQLLDEIALKHATNESSNLYFSISQYRYNLVYKLMINIHLNHIIYIRGCGTNFTVSTIQIQC